MIKRKYKTQPYTTETYRQKVNEMTGDEYTLLSEYTRAHNKVKMRHNTCGFE